MLWPSVVMIFFGGGAVPVKQILPSIVPAAAFDKGASSASPLDPIVQALSKINQGRHFCKKGHFMTNRIGLELAKSNTAWPGANLGLF